MAIRPQHLSKAPIVEAIIGFTFRTPPSDSNTLIDSFYSTIESEYTVRSPIKLAQVTINEQVSTGESQTVGARLVSADGKRVCIVDRENFLCSRLAPYENWENLKSEFERLWGIYSSLSSIQVGKIGVRYINKIFLPEGKDMSLTVKTRPEIADELPQRMFNFFVRLGVKIPDPQGVLVITEAQLPTERPGFATAVLDHDLQFRVESESVDIWSLLERARELKNQYFFASLSDELIKEYI